MTDGSKSREEQTRESQELRRKNEASVEPDYKAMLAQAPSLFMVLDPTLTVVAASDAYLQATLTRRSEIIGRHVSEFCVFPEALDHPADASAPKALASFNRVLQTLATDAMGLLRHDVSKPESEGGGFDARYWSRVNFPILNPDGSLAYILYRVEDVTEFVLLKQRGVGQAKLTDALRKRTSELREHREWLQAMVRSIGDAVIATDAAGMITFMNPIAAELTEWTPADAIGRPVQSIFQIINEKTGRLEENIVEVVLQEGKIVNLANNMSLVIRPGREIPIEDSAAPIRDYDGNVIGMVLVFHDAAEKRRTQKALEQSEEHYRSLFDNMLNGYAYCRMLFEEGEPKDFIYLDVNRAFVTLTGLENVIGKKVSEVIPGIRESDPEMLEFYGRVASTGVTERSEIYVKALDMWLSISVYSPREGHFVAVFDVITERKLAEVELLRVKEQWEQTFDSVPDPIAILDTQYRVVRANRGMSQRLGMAPDQCVGLRCYESVHGSPEPPEFCPHALTLKDGREHFAEMHEGRLGGIFLVSTTPLRDERGVLIGSVHVARDITARKRMEDELRKSHSELERRVRKRTDQLLIANNGLANYAARLEKLNEELEEFAFVSSHDLQEPLRKIQILCDMVKKRSTTAPDDAAQKYLDRVITSASRMRQLLGDMLDFSTVAARPEPLKECDLAKILREAVNEFERTLEEAGGFVEIETLPIIEANETQMLRLFQNLISNALKFRSGESLRIKVYAICDEQGNCEIFVKDNGIGFDQQYAQRIFKPFQRLHRSYEYEGTGMGLTICRKIVELHEGSIRAESEPGKGATFIIKLPLKQDRWDI